jgi:methyl-accepting chemotaxis protein
MNSGAERTSAQAGIVSSSSSSVAGDIAILAGAVEELSASIREIASNTSSANLIGSEAAKEASATNAIVARLGESSAEIGQVIKVITSIAQQTNLLALNATIEAARAGDAGRGFAVVANEVKDLARETAMATEQVSAKIEAIQNETSAAVSAIARIGMTIQRVTEIQTTIAAAVEQQAATTGEITRSVNGAAAGARDITDNINGVAGAAATTAKGAAETQHAASELAVLASQLHALVAQFNS